MTHREINLLPAARANGHKRRVRGLTAYTATVEPIAAPRRRNGRRIAIETHGRDLSYDERARLLAFADEAAR